MTSSTPISPSVQMKPWEAAREAEAAIVRSEYRGPMHGIPVAAKDQWWSKGVRTTAGSTILKDFVPEEDATVMANLKEAGGILLGKTNLNEFALVAGYRYPYGTPANPWDLSRTTGGSSAGSGSATAAGLCATSLGEDTGGSIRNPACYCGVVGMRATWGLVSRHGLLGAAWSFDSIGPISRTVEDCAMTLGAGRRARLQRPLYLEGASTRLHRLFGRGHPEYPGRCGNRTAP